MKKYLRIIGGALLILAVFMMFLPQVCAQWTGLNGKTENQFIGIYALLKGCEWGPKGGVKSTCTPVVSGFVAYMLVAAAGLLVLVCAFVPYIKEHDVLSMVITGFAVVLAIVGIILIFLIRKNFATANGTLNSQIYVGFGAMIGGGLASLGAAASGAGIVFDLLEK